MRLYHLTSIYHLPVIFESGYLKTTESNIDLNPSHEHAGPDVVWLTTSTRPRQGWADMREGLEYVDKCRIQFEVDVPVDDVHLWWDWAEAHGSQRIYMEALAASDVHGSKSRHNDDLTRAAIERARSEWFVIERPIIWAEWLAVRDAVAGTLIWQRSDKQMNEGELYVPRAWERVVQVKLRGLPDGKFEVDVPGLPVGITSREAWEQAVRMRSHPDDE